MNSVLASMEPNTQVFNANSYKETLRLINEHSAAFFKISISSRKRSFLNLRTSAFESEVSGLPGPLNALSS